LLVTTVSRRMRVYNAWALKGAGRLCGLSREPQPGVRETEFGMCVRARRELRGGSWLQPAHAVLLRPGATTSAGALLLRRKRRPQHRGSALGAGACACECRRRAWKPPPCAETAAVQEAASCGHSHSNDMLLMIPWKPSGMPCAYSAPPKLGTSSAPSATLNTGSTSPRMPEIWWTTLPSR